MTKKKKLRMEKARILRIIPWFLGQVLHGYVSRLAEKHQQHSKSHQNGTMSMDSYILCCICTHLWERLGGVVRVLLSLLPLQEELVLDVGREGVERLRVDVHCSHVLFVPSQL